MTVGGKGAGMGADVCAFALGRGRYCMRPAGHETTDGRVARHDSTPPANPDAARVEQQAHSGGGGS